MSGEADVSSCPSVSNQVILDFFQTRMLQLSVTFSPSYHLLTSTYVRRVSVCSRFSISVRFSSLLSVCQTPKSYQLAAVINTLLQICASLFLLSLCQPVCCYSVLFSGFLRHLQIFFCPPFSLPVSIIFRLSLSLSPQ